MPSTAARKHVSRLLASTLAWQGKPEREKTVMANVEEVRKKLSLSPADPSRTPYRVGLQLNWIAPWYEFGGATAVLAEHADGWDTLALGLSYRLLSARLRIARRNPPGAQVVQPNELTNFSLLLAGALAFGALTQATQVARRMIASLEQQELGAWSARPLATFVVSLWARFENVALTVPEGRMAPLGPYGPLLEPASTRRQDLDAACDYHLHETSSKQRDLLSGTFASGPFDVWPAELQAWARVAQRPAEGAPAPDHPLLQTPLGSLQLAAPRELPLDSLLAEVTHAMSDELTW